MGKVRDKLKSGVAKLRHRSVKLCKAVRAIAGPPENDHGSDIVWLGFATDIRLHSGVAHKHKVTGFEVVCQESVLVPALELVDGGKVCLEDIVTNGGKIIFAHLELVGVDSNEIGGQKQLSEVRDKKCCESGVKRKEGLNPMHHVEGGVAGRLADGGTVGPEDMGCASWPL